MWAEASVFGSSVVRVNCGGEQSLSHSVIGIGRAHVDPEVSWYVRV